MHTQNCIPQYILGHSTKLGKKTRISEKLMDACLSVTTDCWFSVLTESLKHASRFMLEMIVGVVLIVVDR